ncbi:hypothetical protein QJQ45_018348, partial [Haematococcus lacustris]
YGLDLFLLSIDEGISGYRDDSLETVKRNEQTYGIPLVVVSYKQLYDWTMDEIVAQIGTKNNCTFCGVRQALDRGAVLSRADKIATGHNADDIAETVLLNMLRGDVPRPSARCCQRRLGRCSSAITGEDGGLPRVKPFKYAYEKEIVMYAYFRRLDYFSTECVYAPFAARGFARDFIKDLEAARPSAILDLIRSADHFAVSLAAQRSPGPAASPGTSLPTALAAASIATLQPATSPAASQLQCPSAAAAGAAAAVGTRAGDSCVAGKGGSASLHEGVAGQLLPGGSGCGASCSSVLNQGQRHGQGQGHHQQPPHQGHCQVHSLQQQHQQHGQKQQTVTGCVKPTCCSANQGCAPAPPPSPPLPLPLAKPDSATMQDAGLKLIPPTQPGQTAPQGIGHSAEVTVEEEVEEVSQADVCLADDNNGSSTPAALASQAAPVNGTMGLATSTMPATPS